MIAERDNLNMDEIMFIDDSFLEIMEAHNIGILSMHTTEALLRFDDMSNISTKGIGKQSEYCNINQRRV